MTAEQILTCSKHISSFGPKCGKPAVYAYADVLMGTILCRCKEHEIIFRGLKVITLEEALVAEVMNE